MKRTIWWDMDGTIADLYGVENWLDMLRAYDATPYAKAKVLHNMSLLARYMNQVQAKGYKIGIISWLSKCSTDEYDAQVVIAKLEWLNIHLASVQFDSIHIVPYGTPKQSFMATKNDILFDDEDKNREAWEGEAFTPDQILDVLKALVRED